MKIILYTDGASRGNPGPAAIGVVLADAGGKIIEELGKAIGTTTNNEAEYRALLLGLERALHRATEIEIRTDSELMARQLKGSYKVRAEHLKPLHDQAQRALKKFKHATIVIIPRALNRRADALANDALNRPPTTDR